MKAISIIDVLVSIVVITSSDTCDKFVGKLKKEHYCNRNLSAAWRERNIFMITPRRDTPNTAIKMPLRIIL